ncbi:hypothetical protein [Mycobacterium sp. MMS18-G62]
MAEDPAINDDLTRQVEREDDHARHELNTAKLVAPFASAIAATFLATALQEKQPSCLEKVGLTASAISMVVAFGLAVIVVFLRRSPTRDLRRKSTAELNALLGATEKNAQRVHWLLMATVGVSALTSFVSLLTMLPEFG